MISSVANPRIKRVRRLRKRIYRDRVGRVLVEGHRAVLPALDAGAVEEILHTAATAGSDAVTRAQASGIRTQAVTPIVMQHLTATSSAPGIIAVARMPSATGVPIPGLLLSEVRDPASEGALIGLAAATGCAGVALLPGCTDAFEPKALRAAGGAQFVIRVGPGPRSVAEAVAAARAKGAGVFALANEGPAPWEVELPQHLALLVGGEDAAVPEDIDGVVAAPPGPVAASLPLRAAAVLYEWVHQKGPDR